MRVHSHCPILVANAMSQADGFQMGKAIDFTLPRTSSGQDSQPSVMVPMGQFRALLRVEENPKGKTTRHWL